LEFEVQRIVGAEEDQLEGTVMFPIKDLNTDSLPDQTKIIMEAVRKKQNKYDISSLSKMILLIHFDDFPFHSWFLPKHEKELVASNFRQVWIINNFDNNRQSVRIK
jgi:hypothetical protein